MCHCGVDVDKKASEEDNQGSVLFLESDVAELQRTIKCRVNVGSEQSKLFEETQRLYTLAYNAATSLGWENKKSNRNTIQKAIYHQFREQHPELKAQLLCSAIKKASESLKSALTLLKKHHKDPKHNKRPSCPTSNIQPVRYDSQKSYWIKDGVARLTVAGPKPVRVPFSIPEGMAHYREWTTASADLCRDRQGRWWLHVVVTKDQLDPEPKDEPVVLGVDLGINVPAMDSDGRRYGHDHWQIVEKRNAAHTARLQTKGTKSAKRRLKKTSGRRKRFRRDCDHVLSKRIVSAVGVGDVVVMEKLTGIRNRAKMRKEQRKRLHRWSFAQLQSFVEYKAEARGVSLVLIDPRYTSQTCNQCGFKDKKNRKAQAEFKCVKCGHTSNADHNAARNIRDKYLKGLPVNQPIVANADPSAVELQASRFQPGAVDMTGGGSCPTISCRSLTEARNISRMLWDHYQNGLVSDAVEKHLATNDAWSKGNTRTPSKNIGQRLVVVENDAGALEVRIGRILDDEELDKANNPEG